MQVGRGKLVRATMAIVVLLVIAAGWFLSRPAISDLEQKSWTALRNDELNVAEEFAREILQRDTDSVTALVVSGWVAERRKLYEVALKFYQRVDDESDSKTVLGRARAGSLLFHRFGRAAEAETLFRLALDQMPDDAYANEQLGLLLAYEGRRWEAIPHLLAAVRGQGFHVHTLAALGWSQPTDPEVIKRCLKAQPEDTVPLIGRARLALLAEDDAETALSLLTRVRDGNDIVGAEALLGRALLELGEIERLVEWHQGLSAQADEHPEVWFVRGLWAESQDDSDGAIRCYWEALRRDQTHQTAAYRLSQVLAGEGRADDGEAFRDHAHRLEQFKQCLWSIQVGTPSAKLQREAAALAESLGLLWEAWGWTHVLMKADPNNGRLREREAQLHERAVAGGAKRTATEHDVTQAVDFSTLEMPRFVRSASSPDNSLPVTVSGDERFVDRAVDVGLTFRYENSADLTTEGMRVFETLGGGVGVLDFDGDQWPDLYFAQGAKHDAGTDSPPPSDRIFRNVDGKLFVDVTDSAGLHEASFTHGVAVGDFNADGFPDVYVGNQGRNRLFSNNGDGTFSDVTEEVGLAGARWTSSCMLADVNGDGWPDLYDVNYLEGADVMTRICGAADRGRICPPSQFSGAQDQLLLNDGQGGFVDVTDKSGVTQSDGKGLGILAADFDGSGGLDVFVANDGEANFFFRNEGRDDGWRFHEQAMLGGLAYDGEGAAQACMGVAAADVDGDHKLDLFVTNYFKESNTLYRRQHSLMFADETVDARLREPSFARLGWGTQFIDANLDGWRDLLVTNGHVDDFTHDNIPFQMSPQFFRNQRGRFVAVDVESDYFTGEYLGRCLTRLDWNRDGREDVVVTHLDRSVALLTNETPRVGRFLAVEFRGRNSSRDAIGARVTVVCGERKWTQHLTGGDGYLASNHRRLTFGVGESDEVTELIVEWPGGERQSFASIACDQEIVVVEGVPHVVRMDAVKQ